MTEAKLRQLLKEGEDVGLEFKLARDALPVNFWDSYSAFANTDGGVIVLGVKDEGGRFSIEGVSKPAKVIAEIWNGVHNPDQVSANILFERHVSTLVCAKKKVVVVKVPRAERTDRPVYIGSDVFKGTFRRNGEGDYRCNKEAVRAMLRDQCFETADACIMEDLSVGDLNADTIKRYRGRFALRRVNSNWNNLPTDEFLVKIGAARKDRQGQVRPTMAGLLCFGDFVTIATALPHYFLDYREYLLKETRWNDRVSSGDPAWSGNIYDFFFRVHDRIVADIPVPFALENGLSRIDETPMHEAIREAVANALIHADYHGRRGIVIEKRFRSITLSNPGTLRMSKAEAVQGGRSDSRNNLVFNIFSLVDIGERSGTGLNNIYALWRQYGYAQPMLRETFDPDQTLLEIAVATDPEVAQNSPETIQKQPQSGPKAVSSGPKVAQKWPKSSPETVRKLSAGTRQIYEALREEPRMTYRGLASKLGFVKETIRKGIGTLIKEGLIRRVGPKKGGWWEVL